MGTMTEFFRKPKVVSYVPDAGEISSGICNITIFSDTTYTVNYLHALIHTSGNVQTTLVKSSYESGIATVENDSYSIAAGDVIALMVA